MGSCYLTDSSPTFEFMNCKGYRRGKEIVFGCRPNLHPCCGSFETLIGFLATFSWGYCRYWSLNCFDVASFGILPDSLYYFICD
ncbi:hypothetical protein O181_112023 [Austropuccinia psidii MF-1]|uniref:Uncharacterized protein n=1 Tax=Austropuccinia psidii MF-1 TaxID=1389203 RepID=A0A9Q3K0K3_9BASI|nr:hypothetical protein [Austropuccinia psidii MF-1]